MCVVNNNTIMLYNVNYNKIETGFHIILQNYADVW